MVILQKGKKIQKTLTSEKKGMDESCVLKRIRYPFDLEDGGEDYLSELEDDDSEDYTRKRRQNKDKLELEL